MTEEDKTFPITNPADADNEWSDPDASIRLLVFPSPDPDTVMMEFTRRVWAPMAVAVDLQVLLDDQNISAQEKDDAIEELVQEHRLRETITWP